MSGDWRGGAGIREAWAVAHPLPGNPGSDESSYPRAAPGAGMALAELQALLARTCDVRGPSTQGAGPGLLAGSGPANFGCGCAWRVHCMVCALWGRARALCVYSPRVIVHVQVWPGSCEGWALHAHSPGRGSLRFGTLRAAQPCCQSYFTARGPSRACVLKFWPLCRTTFASPLPWSLTALPSRDAGRFCSPARDRGADGLDPLHYPAALLSPAPPSPARGARQAAPGETRGAVPYFTRCRAGVRRSSDK